MWLKQISREIWTICVQIVLTRKLSGTRWNEGLQQCKYERMRIAIKILHQQKFPDEGIRVASNGEPLPSARKVRTTLQPTGRVVDRNFNMAALHLAGFLAIDVSAVNGICNNYLFNYLKDTASGF